MRRLGQYWAIAVVGVALLAWMATPAAAEESLITIGTAARGGVYLPTGNAICRLVNAERRRHGLRCVARPSAGSVQNIRDLRTGTRSYGIVQSDVQYAARNGAGAFAKAGPFDQLRAVLSLQAESFTVLARRDALARFADIRGRRVNLGVDGSGMRATVEDVLAVFGLRAGDLAAATELPPGDQAEALCRDRIDVATFVIGHPSGYIQDAANRCDVVLVPVTGPAIDRLLAERPYYAPATIAGQSYAGYPTDVATFGVRATLVTVAGRPEAEVYELTKAVLTNLPIFKRLHPTLVDLARADIASAGQTAPLHPGAERYFREAGLLP